MSDLQNQELLIRYQKTLAKEAPKKASKPSSTVSKEQAMKQILQFSKVKRENVYSSMQVTEDGKLILKSSLGK